MERAGRVDRIKCNATDCVEVRFDGDAVLVRDFKDRAHGPTLAVPTADWATFLDGLAGRH